ncbi:MAG TPA: DNA polymerase III subunit delta [Acidimicrobiaceae bacterium]|nr:DNA polymerase III subunit delta [Acidimicrobiaceae bacterium]HCB37594.1 DNA polymerase III subunit delta [Acidimicrobiaceae bacterium]
MVVAVSGGEVRLLTGADPSLLAEAVSNEVAALAGDIDRSTDVHEFSGEEYAVDAVAIAAATTSLFSSHRLVVVRGLNRFGSAALAPLVEYLAAPTTTTALVLEWGSGRVPKNLADAVKAAGGKTVSAAAPTRAADRNAWFKKRLDAAQVSLEPGAARLIDRHLGDELARLAGLLESLESVFGPGAVLSAADVEPYLGAAGGVPPWDLTDAIDAGDGRKALEVLQRMWHSGRAPLQVMASLSAHYNNAVRLDGAAADEKQAARLLGMKPGAYPAKKALKLSRRLGRAGVVRVAGRLAAADVDLRGGSGLDDRAVVEILVGRLAGTGRR